MAAKVPPTLFENLLEDVCQRIEKKQKTQNSFFARISNLFSCKPIISTESLESPFSFDDEDDLQLSRGSPSNKVIIVDDGGTTLFYGPNGPLRPRIKNIARELLPPKEMNEDSYPVVSFRPEALEILGEEDLEKFERIKFVLPEPLPDDHFLSTVAMFLEAHSKQANKEQAIYEEV